jgi:hypothetical protein
VSIKIINECKINVECDLAKVILIDHKMAHFNNYMWHSGSISSRGEEIASCEIIPRGDSHCNIFDCSLNVAIATTSV